MRNFVVYKSSAGSGKTFTLVKEYLRLSLSEEKKLSFNYKKILAVTFTNKAAAEMKLRVVDALNEIAHSEKESSIGNLLCAELQIPQEALKERAAYLLSNILHNYSDFSIGTIDSFTHKIVKTFAHDLNLPVNFNLETDIDSFYEKIVSELFSKIGEDEFLTNLLKKYSFNKVEDNTSWDPEKQILEFVKLLQKENADSYLQKLAGYSANELEEFRKKFFSFMKGYENFLELKAGEVLKYAKKLNLTTEDFYYGKSGAFNFFQKCFNNTVKAEDTSGSRLTEAVRDHKWLKDVKHPGSSEINSRLSAEATTLINYVDQNYKQYLLCETLSKQIYPLMLIKKLEEISRTKKEEEQIVFISEFNQKIFELINNEPTPFIYERLGEKYHHYLLDEFQDTSGLQWQNILPLLDNSLASGWFNLIVGDGKQSIYRWRNANVKQFANLPEVENTQNSSVIEERTDTLKRNFEGKILDTNYRSTKTIIEFNNNLFDALSAQLLGDEFSGIYKDQAQLVKNPAVGYVSVKSGKTEKDLLDELNFSEIKTYIQKALNSNFNYNDICIISRFNYQGSLIANFLVENNIPVVSSDSLLLKNNLEINTLINFLSYLNNNDNKVCAASVINYLLQSKQINNEQLNSSLQKLSSGNSFFKVLTELNIHLNENSFLLSNLFDNCIHIIYSLGLNKTAPLYTRFFLDEVNEFLVTKNSNLSQFLTWWETRRNKASVIIPDSTNAVKIMTIHASKGLEFPVVIIPFCNWTQYKAGDSWVEINDESVGLPVAVVQLTEKIKNAGLETELEKEKQEQTLDNLNLLYVAFTRAVERLHIITTAKERSTGTSVGNWIDTYISGLKQSGETTFFETGELKPKQITHKKNTLSSFDITPIQFIKDAGVIHIKSDFLSGFGDSEKAKKQGIIFHHIMSKIYSENDVEDALQNALLIGLINSEETSVLKEKISALINNKQLKPFFANTGEMKIERELVTSAGEVLRPDRIVFTDNEAIIIDYKTGVENMKKYNKQMLGYENALKEMGHVNVRKLLVYIDSNEVVELS